MIKKTKSGYVVTSEKGKHLSKPNLSKEEAHHRLAEVEYFKELNKAAGGKVLHKSKK